MAEPGTLTDLEARRLVGAGDTTAPPATDVISQSTSVSEGTMARGSYVPSPTRRRGYNRPVVNDDGTAIAGETNRLLREMLEQLKNIASLLRPQR